MVCCGTALMLSLALGWTLPSAAVVANATSAVTAAKTTQFAIMAERFDREEPARVLADSLRRRGMNPYLFETLADNGSSVFAVRLEIFDSLLQALEARDALAQQAKQPLTITPGGSTEPVNLAAMTLFVQTGEFDAEADARTALADLVARGRESGGMIPLHEAGAPPRILVHAGTYDSYATAAKAAASLSKKLKLQARVNVMDTALYVTRHVPASVAVPEAFVKPDPAPKQAARPTPPSTANATSNAMAAPPGPEPATPPPATPNKPKPEAAKPGTLKPAPSAPAPVAPITPVPIPADAYPPPE